MTSTEAGIKLLLAGIAGVDVEATEDPLRDETRVFIYCRDVSAPHAVIGVTFSRHDLRALLRTEQGGVVRWMRERIVTAAREATDRIVTPEMVGRLAPNPVEIRVALTEGRWLPESLAALQCHPSLRLALLEAPELVNEIASAKRIGRAGARQLLRMRLAIEAKLGAAEQPPLVRQLAYLARLTGPAATCDICQGAGRIAPPFSTPFGAQPRPCPACSGADDEVRP